MLGSFIDNLLGSFCGTTDLGFTGNASQIQNNPKGMLAQCASMPANTSSSEVIRATEKASELEGQQKLLQELSRQKLRQINAGVGAYQVFASHQQGVMRAQERVAQIDQKHDKAVLTHAHAMGVQRAELTGYQAAYQNAMGVFDF